LTIILALIDTSEWPHVFFWITLSSIIILSIANGIYQNCIYGIAAFLPFNYSRVVVFGSYAAGFIISILYLTSIILTQNLRLSAIYYFVGSILILLVCFDTYFISPMSVRINFHLNFKNTTINENVFLLFSAFLSLSQK
jgi:equilibrative nucleoside transporter 1/2/3